MYAIILPSIFSLLCRNTQAAIVDLTAESDELEAELSQRGTLGIIKVRRIWFNCCARSIYLFTGSPSPSLLCDGVPLLHLKSY